ncbi:MAG: PilZ domain-containing protein [Candidatus Aminicenantaceae bacterium]
MEYRGIERRGCTRFSIPGATVRYKQKIHLFSKEEYIEEDYPVLNISRGGILFLSQDRIDIASKINLKIFIPDEQDALIIMGRVRWVLHNPGVSYKYQIGIQFNPYGKKKGHNSPELLEKIIALEKKHIKSG